MLLNILLLLFSVFSASTAVIMIKASTVHPVLLSSLRLFVAAIVLTPLFVRDLRHCRGTYTFDHLKASVVPGVVLAIHLMSWVVGARMTPTANASFIVNLVPLAMPFFLLWLAHEPLRRNEIVATVIALTAVGVVTVSDLNLSSTYFAGDLIAFGSMLFYALYMTLGRRNRHHPTVLLYLVPLYTVAAVMSMIVALFFLNPFAQVYSGREVLLILGLGIIPTVIGHSLVNYAMKHFRGQIVSIINMGQFVFAGLMAFVLWGEVPEPAFFLAAGLLAVAAWVAVGGAARLVGNPHIRGVESLES
ncbi:MAG: DMT family transporter [Anaerolineae bacterium]|nr:DMT family transporter [Anaerolineae bacterium]